jgi:hypothetical protein
VAAPRVRGGRLSLPRGGSDVGGQVFPEIPEELVAAAVVFSPARGGGREGSVRIYRPTRCPVRSRSSGSRGSNSARGVGGSAKAATLTALLTPGRTVPPPTLASSWRPGARQSVSLGTCPAGGLTLLPSPQHPRCHLFRVKHHLAITRGIPQYAYFKVFTNCSFDRSNIFLVASLITENLTSFGEAVSA